MATAPKRQEPESENGFIAAAYIDKDRLSLVLSVKFDPDLPPLPSDLCVMHEDNRISAGSLDIQLDKEQAVVSLLLESILDPGIRVTVSYRPTQWLMCTEDTGDAIEAFDEDVLLLPVDEMDEALRPDSAFDASSKTVTATRAVDAKIRSASEYRIQLDFDDVLDTAQPLEISDFRAELEDRWLNITSAKYIRSEIEGRSDIRLELSEPMEEGGVVQVGYRSPGNRLRTMDAEPVAPFNISGRVDRSLTHNIHDDEADLESVAVVASSESPEISESADTQDASVPDTEDQVADLVAEVGGDVGVSENLASDDAMDVLDAIADEVDSDIADTEADLIQDTHEMPSSTLSVDDELIVDSDELGVPEEDVTLEVPIVEVEEGVESEDDALSPDENPEQIVSESPEEVDAIEPAAETDQDVGLAEAQEAVIGESGESVTASVAREVMSTAIGSGDTPILSPEDIASARAETLEEKSARIQKALESKTVLPVSKPPLTLAAKLIYVIPMIVFAWLLIVVCIYVATIVFDLDWGGAEDPNPIAAVPQRMMPKETCSMKSADGSVYKGECVNGKREGQGVYTWATGNRYEGQWKGGQRHGVGTLNYASGAIYQGEYKAGLESGRGKMVWPNGAVYEGAYIEGKFHGQGMYISADGSRYEGVFDAGRMTENGECMLPSGDKYPGSCKAQ